MGCRCNDRQKLLGQALKAGSQMQPRRVATRVSLVARSAAGDIQRSHQVAAAYLRARIKATRR